MTASGRIRILFAIPELDKGGPDRVLFEVISGLDRAQFAPQLIVEKPDGYYLSRLPADVPVEVIRGRVPRYPVLTALRRVRAQVPDIVFATQRMLLTLGMASLGFPRETRLVLRQANDVSADYAALIAQSPVKHRVAKALTLTMLRRADAVVCQSEAMKRDLEQLLGPRARLHVIPNPIDIERVGQAANARTVTLPGSPALVSVGRLAPQKGFDILLPALATVRARHPGLHVTILGDGPDRAALEALAREHRVADAVTFAGFSKEPLPSVRAAALFVLASRYEGFPNAALEALACGTPVMLTDCPGANSEIVRAGLNGVLAADVTPAAVATALSDAIDALPSFDRARIQSDTGDRYGSRRVLAMYEQLFSRVAGASAARAA